MKNKSFRFGTVILESSKFLLYLSCQMHNIKQWGTTIQIAPLLSLHRLHPRQKWKSITDNATLVCENKFFAILKAPGISQSNQHKEKPTTITPCPCTMMKMINSLAILPIAYFLFLRLSTLEEFTMHHLPLFPSPKKEEKATFASTLTLQNTH